MITLIHGPAELLRAEALAAIRDASDDDPTLIEANTTTLEGRKLSLGELQSVCDTLPFLASRRLVIVQDYLRRSANTSEEKTRPDTAGAQATALAAYLGDVPETTELMIVEGDTVSGGPVLRRLMELQREGRARIIPCPKPTRNDVPVWIRARAEQRKVRLDASAVTDLAEFVGDDLRQLDQELIKLADYANGRVVGRAEVRLLVAATRVASIFEMVDALGMGDTRRAAHLLHQILDSDGEAPLSVLGMIARQFRLILQAKTLQAHGVTRPPKWPVL